MKTNTVMPFVYKSHKLLHYLITGDIKLERGHVISKELMERIVGDYPVYSSSAENNGLFGKYGDYMFDEELVTWSVDGGGYIFYRPKHKFSVTNVCGILRIQSKRFSYRYIYYLLSWEHKKNTFNYVEKAHPSVIAKLYEIPEIDLPEQQKITEILTTVDDAIYKTEAIINKQKRIKQGLLQDLFKYGIDGNGNTRSERSCTFKTVKLGKIEIKIPKEWSVETLESNVRLLSGGTPYKENGENWIGHIPWVSPKDMSVDVVFESLDHISENAMRQLCEAKENDLLLVVRSGVLAHKVPIAIVSKTLAFNQDIKALRIINPKKLNSRYLYYFMKSLEHDLLSRGVKRGTTVHSLNTDYIENILIPIPERTEQENISNILTTIDTSINFQISEVNKLIRIKTGLMENLLTGVTQVNHLVN